MPGLFFLLEELLLVFADTPVEAALDLADGKAGFPCELPGGFLGVVQNVALDVVLCPLFRDVEAFAPEVLLYGDSGFFAIFGGDMVEQVVVVVAHCCRALPVKWLLQALLQCFLRKVTDFRTICQ